MSTLILTGDRYNLASVAQSITPTPAADALFPVTNLYDGTGAPFRWATTDNLYELELDINQMGANWNFSTWSGGLPTSWSTSGTVTEEVVIALSGSSVRLSAGAKIWKDITVRPGQIFYPEFSFYRTHGGTARMYIQNMDTGKFLVGGTPNTWDATELEFYDMVTGSSINTWSVNTAQSFQVESYEACGQKDLVTLRIAFTTSANYVYLDSLVLVPKINFVGFFGHTIAPKYSDISAGPFGGSMSSGTLATPACYIYNANGIVTTANRRFIVSVEWPSGGPVITGTGGDATAPPSIGELVVGQAEAFTLQPSHPGISPWQFSETMPQVRNRTPGGTTYSTALSGYPKRSVVLPYHAVSEAEDKELLIGTYRRSAFGAVPVILVPDTTKTYVIMGRIPEKRQYMQTMSGSSDHYESDLELEEVEYAALGA
jgi:hypothetical protein